VMTGIFFLLFADSIRGKKPGRIREIRLFNSHSCMRRCYFFARLMSAEVVDDVRVCLSIQFNSILYLLFILCVSSALRVSSRLILYLVSSRHSSRMCVFFLTNR